MPTVTLPKSRITAESEGLLVPILSRITSSSNIRNIHVAFPDGTEVAFNGKLLEVPRGLVETSFKPKVGNINPVKEIPLSPSKLAPEVTPVPARTGMLVKFGNLIAVHQLAIELGEQLDKLAPEVNARLKLKEDWDICTKVLASVQPSPARIRAAIAAKTMTRKGGEKRTRIHGYSNR